MKIADGDVLIDFLRGKNDSLIAGIVLHHGGTLLTRNRRHLERVEGLRVSGAEGR